MVMTRKFLQPVHEAHFFFTCHTLEVLDEIFIPVKNNHNKMLAQAFNLNVAVRSKLISRGVLRGP